MSTFSFSFSPASTVLSAERRFLGLAVTLLVHALLLLCWQLARVVPLQDNGVRSAIQWIDLPAPRSVTAPAPAAAVTEPAAPRRQPGVAVAAPVYSAPAPVADVASLPAPAPAPAFSTEAPASQATETVMERARRSAGAADRAVRQQNQPYIVAPLDSPQIRMRSSMEKAHAMVPPALWKAPKVEELVNQSGDGERRTRVITGAGTYCISERATNASVDTIERKGKVRLINCPQHEDPATRQVWRTARD